MNNLREEIKKWVVNDYFTPGIKAEVILDALLTPYIVGIVEDQLKLSGKGGELTFLTKEMSIEDERGNKQGTKIDYVLEDKEYVYLVELKTTKGSIDKDQAQKYIKNCKDGTFGTVLGNRLLSIAKGAFGEKYKKKFEEDFGDQTDRWRYDTLKNAFQMVFQAVPYFEKKYQCKAPKPPFAEAASALIQKAEWAQSDSVRSRKYLYTMGQILDNHRSDYNDLWGKDLKLVYLTPYGDAPHKDLLSVSLYDSKDYLQKQYNEKQDEHAKLLADIMKAIYPQRKGKNDMAQLTIYRGTHQIGGCCTEIISGGERILIDLGANLPDYDAPIPDDALVEKVFDGRETAGLLFTHPHGDHYGLYKKVPEDVPMYIGPMAKEILQVLVSRLDFISEEKGLPAVERMRTYQAGEELGAFREIQALPLYVDHSAPDAYMFYIQTAGKKILYSGDFRDHGIVGEQNRLWRTLEKYVPRGIDLLVTEGTMLSREAEAARNPVKTEEALGQKVEELFSQHKYHFVLVSSINLDSMMEFYHHTPAGMHFVCDAYQAEVMLTAMRGMERKDNYPQYRRSSRHPVIRVVGRCASWSRLRALGASLKEPVGVEPVSDDRLRRDGFVMPVRKNSNPKRKSIFEEMRDEYYSIDGQIIYSMWEGYLKPKHADHALLDYIGDRPWIPLHTSGHACAETIVKLIKAVNPKWIVPMHTERAEEFSQIPAFAPYQDRVRVLQDGQPLSLDDL